MDLVLLFRVLKLEKAIREGRLEDATHWLGRPFQFKGTVIKGDQRGRNIRIPYIKFIAS